MTSEAPFKLPDVTRLSPAGSLSGRPVLLSLILAAVSGFLLFLSAPGPLGSGLWAWVALVPLLFAIDGLRPKQAFLSGLVCGLCFYMPTLHWITIVLGRYGYLHLWLAVAALFLLSLYMGLYTAMFSLLASRNSRAPLFLTAPAIWVGLDAVRSLAFTGFPWMDLGYTQYTYTILIQISDLVGHYGVTFLIVMVNSLLFTMLSSLFYGRRNGSALISLVVATAAAVTVALYGFWRSAEIEQKMQTADRIDISVIQGNIPQDEKWLISRQEDTIDRYMSLSRQALDESPATLLVWPETAIPLFPEENDVLDDIKTRLIGDSGVSLLSGAPHRQPVNGGPGERFFNSAFLVDSGALTCARYDKQHLVPFGEFIPFRKLLPFLAPIVETMGDFTPGTSEKPISCENPEIGVLICFESIFPDLARKQVENGAGLLANITNDAWFGKSSAPEQHLAMAVFRSVETRRSLARAANTGISAFIDPLGRVKQSSALFTSCFLNDSLPLLTVQTVHSRLGPWFGTLCLAAALVLLTLRPRNGQAGGIHFGP